MLDATCVDVDNSKQEWCDGKRNQRETPVEIKHDPEHANQRQHINDDAQQRLRNEILNRVDIGGDCADEIAGGFAIVVSERQALNVMIENASQVVHHPLTDGSRQILFSVSAERTDQCYDDYGEDGEVKNRDFMTECGASNPDIHAGMCFVPNT